MEVCALGVCLVHLRLSSCNIITTFVSELQFPFVIDIESNSLTKYMCNLVNMHPFYNAHLNSSSELFSFLFFFFFQLVLVCSCLDWTVVMKEFLLW